MERGPGISAACRPWYRRGQTGADALAEYALRVERVTTRRD